MLEPGREPHQAVADAELGALLRRQPLVRGRRRMGDQALGVAEIVGDADQLERIEEAERAALPPFDLERDTASSRRVICLRTIVGLRMVGAAGIDQPRDLRMAGERVGDARRGLGLPLRRAAAASPAPSAAPRR